MSYRYVSLSVIMKKTVKLNEPKKKNCICHSFSDISIYIIITINYIRNKIGNAIKNVLKYYMILKSLLKISLFVINHKL